MNDNDFNPQHALPDLLAYFKVRRGMLRREKIAVSVYELSEKGCVIKTDEAFKPGDEIRIAFSLDMPFDNPSTPALLGNISAGRKYCSNFFYGIVFSAYNKRSAFSDIARITDLLERKVALSHRRKGTDRSVKEKTKSALRASGASGLKQAGNGGTI